MKLATWSLGIGPAVAGLLVALLWLDPSQLTNPRGLAAAALGAVVAGALAGVSTQGWHRRQRIRQERLEQASARLAELETRRSDDTARDVEALTVLAAEAHLADDEALLDAQQALEAALRDEERLRARRRDLEADVTHTLQRAREAVGKDLPLGDEIRRLEGRLTELEQLLRRTHEAGDATLTHAVACEEVTRLLDGHVGSSRTAGSDAQSRAEDLDGQLLIVTKLVRRLEARSREIGEVLLVLNDITEQTSLLALNAAIIAAQAGEQGRGFGVVADEMRNLSERAFSSTKETEMLAQTLRDDVGQAVKSMGEASDSVQGLRGALAESNENVNLLSEVGRRASGAAQATVEGWERQSESRREVEARVRTLVEVQLRLAEQERGAIRPAHETLERAQELLDQVWSGGALRNSLRQRLEEAVRAIQDHQGRETEERRRLTSLRETSERCAAALAETRRREDTVREISRDIRQFADSPPGR